MNVTVLTKVSGCLFCAGMDSFDGGGSGHNFVSTVGLTHCNHSSPCVCTLCLLRPVAETAARKCGQTPPKIPSVLLCDMPMCHHCSLRLHCLNFSVQAGTFWEPSHGFVNSSDGGRGHVNQVNYDLQNSAGVTHTPTPSSQ